MALLANNSVVSLTQANAGAAQGATGQLPGFEQNILSAESNLLGRNNSIAPTQPLSTVANNTVPVFNEGTFRVAAKDAFQEFLALFKNNGVVWYRSRSYTGYTTSLEQLGPNAWSPHTGSSTFQNSARRNDVMTRGQVAMYYRDSVYYGYFNSLTWTMEAKNPFRWDFNFTFKVESTVQNLLVPGPTT